MAKDKSAKQKKPFYKKVWFWIVVILLVLGLPGACSSDASDESTNSPEPQKQEQDAATVTYTITGGETGEYGRVVTLNEDTDMPVDKYLYKLPAGTYKVTTTNEKMSAFSIVKDEITTEEGNTDYPEVLDYVTDGQYLLTAGNDDFNGKASKEVEVTIAEDESVSIPAEGDVLIFEAM